MKAIWIAIAIAALAPRADAKGCHERSDVVGLQRCSWFGTWSRDADVPRLWFEVGYVHHAYTSQPYALGTAALSTHDTEQLATTSGSVALRILGGLGDVFYTGVDLAPGWIDKVPPAPGPFANDSFYFSMHAIVGAHASLFRFAASAELAAGFRYEDFANYCAGMMGCTPTDASQTRRELEARVRLDMFVAPRFSVGAMYGKSLIDADDHSLMLYVGLHLRAIDGMR